MNSSMRIGFAVAVAIGLAACGNSNDASDDASADNVEVVADQAMQEGEDYPVEDIPATEPVEETEALAPVEVRSNTEQSEDAAALAERIKAEIAQSQETGAAPAENVEE